MADKDKEDSVLFSLKELKRISPEAREPAPAPPAAAPVQPKRVAAVSDAEAERELASLQRLRADVEGSRAEVERLRQRITSEKQRTGDLARREASLQDARAKGVVPADLVPAPTPLSVPEPSPERQRSVVFRPVALAAMIVLAVGTVAALAGFAFLRRAEVRTVVRPVTVASAGVRALTEGSFDSEIDWLDQGDVAAPRPVAKPRRRRRRRRRYRRRRRKSTAKKQPKIVLPKKPTSGFVY